MSFSWTKDNGFCDMSNGQEPEVLFIGCSDSRVVPEKILGYDTPGKVFVVRNIANQVHHVSAMAAIDYGINVLKIKHVMVCGHTCCGGVRACINNTELPDGPLKTWLVPLKSRLDVFEFNSENDYIRNNILFQVQYLKDKYKTTDIAGYLYDLKSGKMNLVEI